jgi:hypothetical protein
MLNLQMKVSKFQMLGIQLKINLTVQIKLLVYT